MKTKILLLTFIGLSFLFSCEKDNPTNPTTQDLFVTIGIQMWMNKNLNVDHYRNGDSIPEVRDSATWVNSKTGAWCYYNNSDSLGKIYGKLYNWYAVNDPRGLAPEGWHVPSDKEWTILANFLGGDSIAGRKLKEPEYLHWKIHYLNPTNESGFSALPGGCCQSNGAFGALSYIGYWWSSTESANFALSRSLNGMNDNITVNNCDQKVGFSVRCVKD